MLCIIKKLLALSCSAEVKQVRTGKFVLWFSPSVHGEGWWELC